MRSRLLVRLIPVILLGSFAIAYVLARPGLLRANPQIQILEFPVGALVVGLTLWAALAHGRAAKPEVVWRKHEQIVREIPDPALRRDVDALERWVETGENAEAAAAVLARASTPDAQQRATRARELAVELSVRASRKKREAILQRHLEAGA